MFCFYCERLKQLLAGPTRHKGSLLNYKGNHGEDMCVWKRKGGRGKQRLDKKEINKTTKQKFVENT